MTLSAWRLNTARTCNEAALQRQSKLPSKRFHAIYSLCPFGTRTFNTSILALVICTDTLRSSVFLHMKLKLTESLRQRSHLRTGSPSSQINPTQMTRRQPGNGKKVDDVIAHGPTAVSTDQSHRISGSEPRSLLFDITHAGYNELPTRRQWSPRRQGQAFSTSQGSWGILGTHSETTLSCCRH